MMKNNDKRKGNNTKKLIPAAGMLALSASMLATSTYAWFTMSREVEVTGLNMTATVPEDLQISLGAIYKDDNSAIAVETDGFSLANSTGTLKGDDGTVVAPTNTWDWGSSADISAYYQFGKLMPASSRDGATIFYTADATGSGRTVNSVAKYFAANEGLAPWTTGGTAAAASGAENAKATLHAITAKSGAAKDTATDKWDPSGATGTTYVKATGWDTTNDDGYYVDIPIWLRSSATEDINLKVEGYVLPQSGNTGKLDTAIELYRSVRVALLNGDTQGIKPATGDTPDVTAGSVVSTNNILPLVDALDKTKVDGNGKYTEITNISDPFTATANNPVILDSGIYIERTSENTGLWAVNTLSNYVAADVTADKTGHINTSDKKANYTSYTAYDGTSAVATVKANTTSDTYGEMKKLWIRVWLDGEDEECWNDNAGQDWAISLKFSKI